VNSGQSLKKIWEALASEGLQMSYHSFTRQYGAPEGGNQPLPATGGNRISLLRRKPLPETKVEAVEGRDPFANLKRLEKTGLVFIGGVHGI